MGGVMTAHADELSDMDSDQDWLQYRPIVFTMARSVFTDMGFRRTVVLCRSCFECVLDRVDAAPAEHFGVLEMR